jgi:hypothetical protein
MQRRRGGHLHAYLVLPFEREMKGLTQRINEAGIGWPHLDWCESCAPSGRATGPGSRGKVQKEVAWLPEATVRQHLCDRMRAPGDKERLDHQLDRVVIGPVTAFACREAEFVAYFTELDSREAARATQIGEREELGVDHAIEAAR